MASNNPQQQQQQQQQQQHPLPPPPAGTSGSSFGSGGGSSTGHGGIGRSAPIRTLPAPGPPSLTVPSLPGGMGTPPLVKSKLALTPGRVVGAGVSGGGGKSLPAAAAAAAAGRPPSKLPPSIPPPQQQQQHQHQPQVMPPPLPQQPPPLHYYQQTNDNYAPSTPVTNDPISSSRKTNIADPAAAASRQTLGQSPGIAAATAPAGSVAGRGGAEAPQRQPHIVSLPPPTQTAFHPLDVGAGGANQQQQQQNYGVYSHQSAGAGQHPLKQPPASAPSFKQPPQQTSSQALPQTTSSSSSPAKRQPPRTNKPPSTPDEEVDAFLRGPATAASSVNNNKVRKLRPSPLPPSQTKLQKTKILAYRRAWGDVIRVTNDALLGKEGGGVHHCCYSELAAAAAAAASAASSSNAGASGGAGGSLVPDASAVAAGKELEKLRRETSEMLALRFISQLKLRRYADLGKEVQHLGLLPFLPDHAGFPTMAISGLDAGAHDLVKDGSSSLPSSPGTTVTEASIDMLSSSPVKKSKQPSNGGSSSNNNDKPMAWKEGSLHSTHPSDPLPSWVPFGLRILAAHQLQYNDGASKSIDVLYDLRDRTIRTDHWGTAGMEIWRGVIDVALVNAFVRKREWRLALRGLEELMGGLEGGVLREVDWWCSHGGSSNVNDVGATVGEEERKVLAEVITAAAHVELLSRQILILLQSGAISAAETIQNAVRLHAAEVQSLLNPAAMTTTLLRVANELALVRQAPLRQKVNEGLLLFARCQYTDACQHFRDALAQQRELDSVAVARQSQPAGCPTWKDLSSPTLGFDAEPSLTVECLNNLSLCLLYAGNMRSSVQELEGLTREDPCRYLTEGMAFNLCTLYELGSDGEECTKKKKLLQRVAKRFYLHDVGVESFRLG